MAPGRIIVIIFKPITNVSRKVTVRLTVKLLSDEYLWTLSNEKSTLIQIMVWYHQVTSHYQISCHHMASLGHNELTLSMRGPSYLGLTRSISWLLMPWVLMSPGHQQPWYWLYRICTSFSYLRKDFKYLCQINVEEWHKMQIYVYVPSGIFTICIISLLRTYIRYKYIFMVLCKAQYTKGYIFSHSSHRHR